MPGKIVIKTKDSQLEEFIINENDVHIGRIADNDIQLDNLAVSAQHAVIKKQNSSYLIEDLDSTNGTLLNDHLVSTHRLKHLDQIKIGNYYLQFHVDTDLGGDDLKKASIARSSSQTNDTAQRSLLERTYAQAKRIDKTSYMRALASRLKENTADDNANTDSTSSSSIPIENQPETRVGKLRIVSGKHSGSSFILKKAVTRLNQVASSPVTLQRNSDGYLIEVKPGNNIRLNGVRVYKTTLLESNDIIDVGNFTLEFSLLDLA